MTLTVEGLIMAIQSARDIEKLQAELRDALIARLIKPPPPSEQIISGAPAN